MRSLSDWAGRTYYEFFAGGGMARAGLGGSWKCLFANDCDPKKTAVYALNWGGLGLTTSDASDLSIADLPSAAGLAWASFPCQDLSLAGSGGGLQGDRSGAFWAFWKLVRGLAGEGRAPAVVVLENVCGALTSRQGSDFSALCTALAGEDYRFGAMVIDAIHFVPQSRPRLFIVAIDRRAAVPAWLRRAAPHPAWSPAALVEAHQKLANDTRERWIWWNLPVPESRTAALSDLIEEEPLSVRWHTESETRHLLGLMSALHREKVEQQRRAGGRAIGAIYRRTRRDENGNRMQRAEVRFDGVAGCLRTPAGGSSRQSILFIEGVRIRSRLLSPREAARLMGLPESYKLPTKYNDAYHLAGDGVSVPVVRHLAAHLLEPLVDASQPVIYSERDACAAGSLLSMRS